MLATLCKEMLLISQGQRIYTVVSGENSLEIVKLDKSKTIYWKRPTSFILFFSLLIFISKQIRRFLWFLEVKVVKLTQ